MTDRLATICAPPVMPDPLHGALMVGLGAALWGLLAPGAERTHRWGEAGIFVYAALGLGFLGHIGQVYQTTSPTWMPPLMT